VLEKIFGGIGVVIVLVAIFIKYDKSTGCRIWFGQEKRPSIMTK
jgi:hypothetical protein